MPWFHCQTFFPWGLAGSTQSRGRGWGLPMPWDHGIRGNSWSGNVWNINIHDCPWNSMNIWILSIRGSRYFHNMSKPSEWYLLQFFTRPPTEQGCFSRIWKRQPSVRPGTNSLQTRWRSPWRSIASWKHVPRWRWWYGRGITRREWVRIRLFASIIDHIRLHIRSY